MYIRTNFIVFLERKIHKSLFRLMYRKGGHDKYLVIQVQTCCHLYGMRLMCGVAFSQVFSACQKHTTCMYVRGPTYNLFWAQDTKLNAFHRPQRHGGLEGGRHFAVG